MSTTTDHSTETAQSLPALDSFVADRQAFWTSFTRFVTMGAGAVIVLLILMTIFLV